MYRSDAINRGGFLVYNDVCVIRFKFLYVITELNSKYVLCFAQLPLILHVIKIRKWARRGLPLHISCIWMSLRVSSRKGGGGKEKIWKIVPVITVTWRKTSPGAPLLIIIRHHDRYKKFRSLIMYIDISTLYHTCKNCKTYWCGSRGNSEWR